MNKKRPELERAAGRAAREDLAKFGMKELEAQNAVKGLGSLVAWCASPVLWCQADTVALMMRRVYDIGGHSLCPNRAKIAVVLEKLKGLVRSGKASRQEPAETDVLCT